MITKFRWSQQLDPIPIPNSWETVSMGKIMPFTILNYIEINSNGKKAINGLLISYMVVFLSHNRQSKYIYDKIYNITCMKINNNVNNRGNKLRGQK